MLFFLIIKTFFMHIQLTLFSLPLYTSLRCHPHHIHYSFQYVYAIHPSIHFVATHVIYLSVFILNIVITPSINVLKWTGCSPALISATRTGPGSSEFNDWSFSASSPCRLLLRLLQTVHLVWRSIFYRFSRI